MSLCLRESHPASQCEPVECSFIYRPFVQHGHHTVFSLAPRGTSGERARERGILSLPLSSVLSPLILRRERKKFLGTEISNPIPRSRWFPSRRVTGWVRGSCFSSRKEREGRREHVEGKVLRGQRSRRLSQSRPISLFVVFLNCYDSADGLNPP